MDEHLLTVNDLTISFDGADKPAVKSVSFGIAPGECVAIVGESGSGKTMTALSFMQLLPPSAYVSNSSHILYRNEDILLKTERQMRAIRGKKIAMIFQDAMTALNPVLTIGYQIIEVIMLHQRLSKSKARARALSLLENVGISHAAQCLKNYPHQLSGGMRQRAMIAMALACEPELLIADEPSTALDVSIQAQVMALLLSLKKEKGLTILFITHDLALVKQIADRLIVMEKGVVVEEANTADFYCKPTHPYTKKLLAALPGLVPLQPQTPPGEVLLDVTELAVHFPIKKGVFKRTVGMVKAIDGVSMQCYAGKTLAIVGESGSGKSTSARACINLITPSSGNIQFNSDSMQNMQMIFQDPYASLNPRMQVFDCLMEGLRAQGKAGSRQAQIQEATRLLQQVALSADSLWRYPHAFSGGERQRICIARALSMSPKLLILDEPTSALDVSIQAQVLTLLLELQQTLGLTYLLITHNFGVVATLAHHIVVMQGGKVVECGDTKTVLSSPQHAYTQTLLSQVPA